MPSQTPLPGPGEWPCQRVPPDKLPPALVSFLYRLHRDFVQPGVAEQVMLDIRTHAGRDPDYTNEHLEALARAHATELLGILAGLEDAVRRLFANQLSSSSGGDPGMVFDASDAAVERQRTGTVTFDRQAVDDVKALIEVADELRARE